VQEETILPQEKEVNDMKEKGLAGRSATRGKARTKKILFEFSAPEAREVFIAGDFNNWGVRASPLKKDKNGVWKITLPLMPGRYEYRFISDGKWENDPSCLGCVPNEFGSLNCVKVVE
jgi:1,4-alpha-glucan branching enzyme